MGHTFSNNLYHIIFSTKKRRPIITTSHRHEIIRYMCGIMKNKHGIPLCVNAVEDHLHILAKVSPDMPVSKFVGEVKGNSSKWISDTFPDIRDFAWQAGYACFTVSESARGSVAAYIKDQQEHHSRGSFADELAAMLRKNGVAFDPKHYLD